MKRIAAASSAFNAFGSISCVLIVKRIDDFHNGEFLLLYCSQIYGRNYHSHLNSTVRISNLAKFELKVKSSPGLIGLVFMFFLSLKY